MGDRWLILLADSERRRVNALLLVVAAMAAFVWLELGRRLGVMAAVASARGQVVDSRLDTLTGDQLSHAGRTQGVSSVFKTASAIALTCAALIAIFVPLLATHTIG